MTKKILIVMIASVSVLMVSCGNEKQKMNDEISSAEQKLKNDSSVVIDKQKAAEVIHLYLAYAEKFKDDSLSAEYLFRAADVTNGIHQPDKAIELYERVQQFKSYSKTPVSLFLQGFIAETELQDMQRAKEYYEKFLKQYPDHKLANDVKITIANLGKSPEELIKEFEAKASSDSVAMN